MRCLWWCALIWIDLTDFTLTDGDGDDGGKSVNNLNDCLYNVYMCHDDGNESEMLTYMPFISELSALLVEFVTTERGYNWHKNVTICWVDVINVNKWLCWEL